VLHQIGVGALGPVFRTYEPTRDRLVAVKVFRLDITPEQAQSLAEELARAAEAGLFHPSIVEPLAAGVEGTVAYRAEEYVAAETLDVAMRHYAPAPLEKALPFVTQLAGAIDFARAGGVGHGALHPRDIFVTPEEARATGFGVVDALERVGLRAPVRRPYSPPERIAGEAWGTPADVFSLGAIAFELLTGRRPSGTGDGIGTLNAGPDSDRLRRVLARAMHDDPAARYPTALAFAAALEGSGETASVVPFKPVAAPEPEPAPAPIARPAAIEPPAIVAPPPQPAAPVGPPPPAPLAPVEPEPTFASEPDDIAAERDEDIAHWNYSVNEARTSEVEADEPPTLFDEREQEAAADELFLDAADLTLNETRGAKEPVADTRLSDFEDEEGPGPLESGPEPEPTPPVPYLSEPRPRAEHTAPRSSLSITSPGVDDLTLAEPDRDTRFDGDDSRRPMTPYAIVMVLGLLLGALGMYAYLSKRDTRESISTAATPSAPAVPATTAPADSQTATQTPPPTKEFSERAVTPPNVPAESAGRAGGRGPAPKPKPPAPSASPSPPSASLRTARLIVNSTPAGASVTINGRWRGRTPLTLDSLPLGNYVVRIVATGYDVYREDVLLSSSQESRTISERLRRSAPAARGSATPSRGTPQQPGARPTPPLSPVTFVGSIYVDSRPRGAKVFIDGKEVGTTPLKMPELSIGAHVIRLELKDHHTWTSSVRITSGEEQRVTGSLEPIR